MEREALIKKTIHRIEQLPTTRIREVSDFVEFIVQRANDAIMTEELQQLSSSSSVFNFLHDDPELYTMNDLKVKFS
jgi:hypothetical protein